MSYLDQEKSMSETTKVVGEGTDCALLDVGLLPCTGVTAWLSVTIKGSILSLDGTFMDGVRVLV